jgi:murein tripeptide amidase MpaA
MKLKYLLLVSLVTFSCKSTSEFTGFSYDPPGVANTTSKEIVDQKRRIIGAGESKVWISNEFEGARALDFYQIAKDTFEVVIEPENFPINNSPWYGFKIWADEAQPINLRLAYKEGRHRYLPKIYRKDGSLSLTHIVENAEFDTTTGTASFDLFVEKTPQIISAQFMDGILFSDLLQSLELFKQISVEADTVGYSNRNRPIIELTVDEPSSIQNKGVLALLSRQHPPEIAGHKAFQVLFNTLLSNTELAKTFREHFVIIAYPIINPDGVVDGHWRHNAGGVDLNRDWINFNQPETRAVRDALIEAVAEDGRQMYYAVDFHSTNENIFYPMLEEIETTPDNISQRWFTMVDEANPTLDFSTEEFDTTSPISKNWLYRTFGTDALTYEVRDELTFVDIQKLGVTSANSLMELLLEEWQNANSN